MKYLIIALIAVVVIVGAYFVLRGGSNTYNYSANPADNSASGNLPASGTTDNSAQNPAATSGIPTDNTQNQNAGPAAGTTGNTPAPASGQKTPSTVTVTYTDSGFSPSTVTVKKGDTVVFRNSASDDVRVASNPHPIHNGYPTTGGCVSSTFDSCSNIAPGQSWSFTFDIVGTWGYHNHLNPSEGGTVIVQ